MTLLSALYFPNRLVCTTSNSRLLKIISFVIVWTHLLNFCMICIVNPSLLNPGPQSRENTTKVYYQNVQGLIPISNLNNKNPEMNTTKLLEIQAHILKKGYDIIILNETWLKPSIHDNEILPYDQYKIFRLDRSRKTHPTEPKNSSTKFRNNGGGVLIAIKNDLEVTTKIVNINCAAEILSIEITLPNKTKFAICTLYRVGTLGSANYSEVETYLNKLRNRRGLAHMIVVGDLKLNKVDWDSQHSSCVTDQCFIDLFNNLGLSQLISPPTHNKGNILDLILTNSPRIIQNINKKILSVSLTITQ